MVNVLLRKMRWSRSRTCRTCNFPLQESIVQTLPFPGAGSSFSCGSCPPWGAESARRVSGTGAAGHARGSALIPAVGLDGANQRFVACWGRFGRGQFGLGDNRVGFGKQQNDEKDQDRNCYHLDGHKGRHGGVSRNSATPISRPDHGQLAGQADHDSARTHSRRAGRRSRQREEQPRKGAGDTGSINCEKWPQIFQGRRSGPGPRPTKREGQNDTQLQVSIFGEPRRECASPRRGIFRPASPTRAHTRARQIK